MRPTEKYILKNRYAPSMEDREIKITVNIGGAYFGLLGGFGENIV